MGIFGCMVYDLFVLIFENTCINLLAAV